MIALIDADHIPYIVCHNKIDEPEKTLTECIDGANSYLQGLVNGCKADEFYLFFTIGKNFRYDIYPEYKANRKNLEKPAYFYDVRDYLVNEYQGISFVGLEADDLLCIYKKKYVDESKPYIVVSTDKDINNLEGMNYDIKNDVIRIVDSEFAEQYFWTSLVTGDTADNIKGIPGKGPAFAKKLWEQCKDSGESLNLFKAKVISEYLNYFGELKGVEEFYKNYKCLKIIDFHDSIQFVPPLNTSLIYAKTLGMAFE